ncbi:MAG: CRISPR system precrRNA processing endoribonuclease RAMP protein Cas6 [Myxococcales bacterium]|nr:CRISPR system precrRNA processing endoribonuclease RAMP protein Cas6 [Myxococcales bacterium]
MIDAPLGPAPPRVTRARYLLHFRAADRLRLPPYPGATFRGALGTAWRASTCTTGAPDCDGCPRRDRCPFGLTWERLVTGPEVPNRASSPPRPYVFRFESPPGGALAPGAALSFEMMLFGSARAYAPTWVLAAQRLADLGLTADRVPVHLVRVESAQGPPLWTVGEGFARFDAAACEAIAPTPLGDGPARVRLRFLTPLALKSQGRIGAFAPAAFTARLADRLSAMAHLYDDAPVDWDVKGLLALADSVKVLDNQAQETTFERFSNRMRAKVPMRGLLGEVVVDDVHPALLGLWRCAEAVHVGKNATFGFGRVEVDAF